MSVILINKCFKIFSILMNNRILKNNYRLVWAICRMSTVFAYCLGDLGSIQGRVIPKTQKMVLGAALLSTQHYKVRIEGKV